MGSSHCGLTTNKNASSANPSELSAVEGHLWVKRFLMPRAWLGRLAEPLSSNVLWPKRTWILLLHCSCCISARTSLKGKTRYSSNYRMYEHDLAHKVCNYSEFPQVAGSDRSQMPGRKTLRQPPSLQSLGHCSNASKNMNLDINQ